MKTISIFAVMGTVALLGCVETAPDGLDTFFAENTGKEVGHAEALAQACPSLTLDLAAVALQKNAICQAEGLGDDCALESFDSNRAKSFQDTMAALAGMPAEKVCADARAEAAADSELAGYLN